MTAEPSTPQYAITWDDGVPASSLVLELACDGDVSACDLADREHDPEYEPWREIVLVRRLS